MHEAPYRPIISILTLLIQPHVNCYMLLAFLLQLQNFLKIEFSMYKFAAPESPALFHLLDSSNYVAHIIPPQMLSSENQSAYQGFEDYVAC